MTTSQPSAPRVSYSLSYNGRRGEWIVTRTTTEEVASHEDHDTADAIYRTFRDG